MHPALCYAATKFSRICKVKLATDSRCQYASIPQRNATTSVSHINSTFKIQQSYSTLPCMYSTLPYSTLPCGHVYIGQSRHYVNIRLREHLSSLQRFFFIHLPLDCSECGCTPCFNNTDILYSHKKQVSRELVEAFQVFTKRRR